METTEAVSLEESLVPDESKEIRIAASHVISPLRKPGNGPLQDVSSDTRTLEPKIIAATASRTTSTPRLPIASRTLWYPLAASPPDKHSIETTPISKETLPHSQNYNPRVLPNSTDTIDSSQTPEAMPLLKSRSSDSQKDGTVAKTDDSSIMKPLSERKRKDDITKSVSTSKVTEPVLHTHLAPSQRPKSPYRMPRIYHGVEEAQQRLDSKIRVAELRLQREQGNASLLLQQQNQKRENIVAAAQIQALRLQQRQQQILTAAEISSLNRRDSHPVAQREIKILKVPMWRREDVARSPHRYEEIYSEAHRTHAITPKHTSSEFSEHFSETHPTLMRISDRKDTAPSRSQVLELQGQETRVSHTRTSSHPLMSKNDRTKDHVVNEKQDFHIDRGRMEAFPTETEKLRSTPASNQVLHPVTHDAGNVKRSDYAPQEIAKRRTLNSSPEHSMVQLDSNEKSVRASHPHVPFLKNRPIRHEPELLARHSSARSGTRLQVARQMLQSSFPLQRERASQASRQHGRPNINQTTGPRSDAHHLQLRPQAHSEESREPLAIHQKLFEQSKEHPTSGSERQTLLHKRDDAPKIFRVDDEGGIHEYPVSGARRSDTSTTEKRSQSTSPFVIRVDEDGGLHYTQKHPSRPMSHHERPPRVQQKENSLYHTLVQTQTPSRPKTVPLYPQRESSEITHRLLTPAKEVDYVDEDGGIHRSVIHHPRPLHSMQNLSRRDGILVSPHVIRRHRSSHILILPMERAKHPHVIPIHNRDMHTRHFHLERRPSQSSVVNS